MRNGQTPPEGSSRRARTTNRLVRAVASEQNQAQNSPSPFSAHRISRLSRRNWPRSSLVHFPTPWLAAACRVVNLPGRQAWRSDARRDLRTRGRCVLGKMTQSREQSGRESRSSVESEPRNFHRPRSLSCIVQTVAGTTCIFHQLSVHGESRLERQRRGEHNVEWPTGIGAKGQRRRRRRCPARRRAPSSYVDFAYTKENHMTWWRSSTTTGRSFRRTPGRSRRQPGTPTGRTRIVIMSS